MSLLNNQPREKERFSDIHQKQVSPFLQDIGHLLIREKVQQKSLANQKHKTSKLQPMHDIPSKLTDRVFINDQETGLSECVFLDDLFYLAKKGETCEVHTLHKKYVLKSSLEFVLQSLPSNSLIRCHPVYAINIQKVVSFDRGGVFMELPKDRVRLLVSEDYRKTIFSQFMTLRAN